MEIVTYEDDLESASLGDHDDPEIDTDLSKELVEECQFTPIQWFDKLWLNNLMIELN